jgi:hypothetical protein
MPWLGRFSASAKAASSSKTLSDFNPLHIIGAWGWSAGLLFVIGLIVLVNLVVREITLKKESENE